MKILPWFCSVLLLQFAVGCAGGPRVHGDGLDADALAYAAVKIGETPSGVETRLGPPAGYDAEGAAVWEKRIGEGNYTRLRVWYGANGKVKKVETTRGHATSYVK